MRLLTLIAFLFSLNVNAFCRNGVGWVDSSNKKIQVAALGSFYRNSKKVIFKPIICMNMDKCEEIDLTSFPKKYLSTSMSPVWDRVGKFGDREKISFGDEVGVLWVIFTLEKNFADAISLQKVYEQKLNTGEVSELTRMKAHKTIFDEDSCRNELYTILKYKDSFTPNSSKGYFNLDFNFNLTYAKFAEEKMKGCGCEEYFGDNVKFRQRPDTLIEGKFVKEGANLFFVEYVRKSSETRSITEVNKKIELTEGDRCNVFASELENKFVLISAYEKLPEKENKMKYLNVCQYPIMQVW